MHACMRNAGMAYEMLTKKHPICLEADGVFFVVPCGDRLVVKDAGGYIPETSVRTWLPAPIRRDRHRWSDGGP
jgi:hypothetical protein